MKRSARLLSITGAVILALSGAGMVLGPSAQATSVRYHICDGNGGCWTNEGFGEPLGLTGATAYALYNPATVTVNGESETAWEFESPDGDCVTALEGAFTGEGTCKKGDKAQEFWLTGSQAMYSVGVSDYYGHDWCEIDNYTPGFVQNTPCTSAADQPNSESFYEFEV
jgi:hypothetical protein